MGERMKLLILTLVLFAFGLILGSGMKLMTWIDGPSAHPPPVASNASVERKIHLVMESRYDSDRPRKFVCREAP
jgi:hypothetical protein